jgi:glutamate decarboxylase
MGAGMVLFRDVEALTSVEHHANYVIRKGSRDIGKHTLEGSRAGMAMLVHSALRIIGQHGYELLVELGIARAEEFARMIQSEPDFELMTAPVLNLLTYRYVPKNLKLQLNLSDPSGCRETNERLNLLTELIQKEQRSNGKTFVSRSRIEFVKYGGQELTVLRVVLANPLVTRKILEDILIEQRLYGERIFRAMESDATKAST